MPHAPILGIQSCQPLQIPTDFQNFMSLGQKVLAHPLIVNQTAMYTNQIMIDRFSFKVLGIETHSTYLSSCAPYL